MVLIKVAQPAFNEMDLIDTLSNLEELTCVFVDQIEILKDLETAYSSEVGNLLSKETLERCKSNTRVLKYPYKNYLDSKDSTELKEGFLIQSWSSMGSILESTLQIFLAFYYRDYIKTNINIWNEDVLARLRELLKTEWNDQLKKLVNEDGFEFSGKDRKSLLEKIRKIINEKQLPSIEEMTLEPLIAFYYANEIIEPKEYTAEELRRIRDYRNAVHSFKKRAIGDWCELESYGKVLLMFIFDLYDRLPDIPDEIPLTIKRYESQQKIQRMYQMWFEYDVRERNRGNH